MSLRRELYALLPIRSDRFSLESGEFVDEDAPEVADPAGPLRATVRTVTWEVGDEGRSILDIREQEVIWLHARHREDPRVRAYMAGWAAALQFVVDRHAELQAVGRLPRRVAERLEFALPCELFCPAVLDLKRPQTADDFTEALLTNKKRLGMFLP
ncbi:MAG TPA: hypothetical protein VIK91_22560 [Nannocystis sp.]